MDLQTKFSVILSNTLESYDLEKIWHGIIDFEVYEPSKLVEMINNLHYFMIINKIKSQELKCLLLETKHMVLHEELSKTDILFVVQMIDKIKTLFLCGTEIEKEINHLTMYG